MKSRPVQDPLKSSAMRNPWTVSRSSKPAALFVAGALAFFTVGAGQAESQVNFAVEGRVGVTAPLADLKDAGAASGIGLGAELFINFNPKMSVYAGLHRDAFNCDDDCSLGGDPRSTGFVVGLKYFAHNPGDVLVWVRGGVVANTWGNNDGSGDRRTGFELGAGADLAIGTQLYVVPNLGFVNHNARGGLTARYLTFGMGLHYHIR